MGGDDVFDWAVEIGLVRRGRRWNRHTDAAQERMEAFLKYADAEGLGVFSQEQRVPSLALKAIDRLTQVVHGLIVEEDAGNVVDDGFKRAAPGVGNRGT